MDEINNIIHGVSIAYEKALYVIYKAVATFRDDLVLSTDAVYGTHIHSSNPWKAIVVQISPQSLEYITLQPIVIMRTLLKLH